MAEVIVPANSDFVDKTVAEADFRSRYGLTAVGLRRGGTATETSLQNKRLKIGDNLLVIGPWTSIRKVQSNGKDLVVFNLPVELEEVLPVAGKAFHAVACLALVVGLMVSGIIPNVQAALIGCLLMGVLGCVNLNSAYRAIDWKTIVLIVGGCCRFPLLWRGRAALKWLPTASWPWSAGQEIMPSWPRSSRSRHFSGCLSRILPRPS